MSLLDKISDDIKAEYVNSNKKHRSYFASTHEAWAVTKEEIEELQLAIDRFWDSVKKDDLEECKKEARQVGAMAIKFLITFDKIDKLEF